MELESKMIMFDDTVKAGTTEEKENVLQEANRLIHGERNQDYCHPLDDYEATAMIWSGILRRKLKENLTAEEAQLCMIGVKLSRESRKHKRDNLVDAAGYAGCIEMTIDEREKRATWVDKEMQRVVERLKDNTFREGIKCRVCGATMEHQFQETYRCKFCGIWSES